MSNRDRFDASDPAAPAGFVTWGEQLSDDVDQLNDDAVLDTDPRLSDERVPTDGSVTDAKVASDAAIDPSKIAGTAVVDDDSRLTDERTPTDGSVTGAKIADGAVTEEKLAAPDGSSTGDMFIIEVTASGITFVEVEEVAE